MNPLVSILIITYNSSSTIIETLESAKKQSYDNIELIVSDDCSKDNTVEICNSWIEKNGNRFVNCKMVVSKENRGVSANFNQAILNATGEWAKLIAGDDIMLSDCIKDNIRFVNENRDAFFVFSKMTSFEEKNGMKIYKEEYPKAQDCADFFAKAPDEQHRLLCIKNCIPAPTTFCHLNTMKANLFKEQYRYCEDYPQWFSLTGKGYKLYFNPVQTVLYRVSGSLTNSKKIFYNPNVMETYKLFFYNEMSYYLLKNDLNGYHRQIKFIFMCDFAIHILNNKSNFFNRIIFKLVSLLLNK